MSAPTTNPTRLALRENLRLTRHAMGRLTDLTLDVTSDNYEDRKTTAVEALTAIHRTPPIRLTYARNPGALVRAMHREVASLAGAAEQITRALCSLRETA